MRTTRELKRTKHGPWLSRTPIHRDQIGNSGNETEIRVKTKRKSMLALDAGLTPPKRKKPKEKRKNKTEKKNRIYIFPGMRGAK